MTKQASRRIALAGLALVAVLLAWPPGATGLAGAAPLVVVLGAGALSAPRWAITTAIVMLPYFAWGVMSILTDPAGRLRAIVFATLTIVVFLAALDSMRRR